MGIRDLQPFRQQQTWKRYIIDSRDKIPKNSNEFLRSLVKSLKIKFLHSMTSSTRMLSIWGFFPADEAVARGVL